MGYNQGSPWGKGQEIGLQHKGKGMISFQGSSTHFEKGSSWTEKGNNKPTQLLLMKAQGTKAGSQEAASALYRTVINPVISSDQRL